MEVVNVSRRLTGRLPENPLKERYNEIPTPSLMSILEFLGSSAIVLCLLVIGLLIKECFKKVHRPSIRSV